MKYQVYKATNTINGKGYVGMCNNFEQRKNSHRSSINSTTTPISQALSENWDDFEWKILVSGITEEEAEVLESYYIELKGTLYPNGYNMTTGGKSGYVVVKQQSDSIPYVRKEPTTKPINEEKSREISDIIRVEGYELIEGYRNARTKLKLRCPNGHIFETLYNNWRKGSRCGVCYREKLRNGVISVVDQGTSNVTTPINENSVISVVDQETSNMTTLYDNELYKKYVRMFVGYHKDKVMKVKKSIDGRQFTLECRGNILDMVVLDSINDNAPSDCYPIFLDVSDYKTDEDYIKEWMTECVRG